MTKFKRAFCGVLAAFLILYVPVTSYAFSSWDVLEAELTGFSYFFGAILSACGVLVGDDTISRLFGNWDSPETYLALGEQGRLGAYAQWVYNNACSINPETKKKYKEIESLFFSSLELSWGIYVSGIRAIILDLKEFLKSCYGFDSWETTNILHIPAIPDSQTWGVTEWSSLDFYPLPTTGVNVPPVAKNSNYTLFLTSYVLSAWKPTTMNVQNWYFAHAKDIFGVYDVDKRILTTYERDAENAQYKSYSGIAYSAYVNEDGTLKYSIQSTNWWQRDTILCSSDCAGNLPFPVFGTMEDAMNYVSTGEVINPYISGTVSVNVDSFRKDVFDLPDTSIPDTFIFPSSEEEAKECVKNIINVYPTGVLADISGSLKTGGLDLEIPVKLPDDDKKKPVWLGWLVSEILDWLFGQTLDDIIDWLLGETEKINEDEGEIIIEPVVGVKDRFPFCIPFDLIYLVKCLEAESEIPRIEIPIDVDYEFIEYHEVFVVDFYDWITVVNILRAMLDIWFIAGLIVSTRNIMRG